MLLRARNHFSAATTRLTTTAIPKIRSQTSACRGAVSKIVFITGR